MNIIQKLHVILDPNGSKSLYTIFGLSVIVSILDMFGAASIMPVIGVVSNPDFVFENAKFCLLYTSDAADEV